MLVTRASNMIIVTQGKHIPNSVDILTSITRISSDDEQVQLGTNLISTKIMAKATTR